MTTIAQSAAVTTDSTQRSSTSNFEMSKAGTAVVLILVFGTTLAAIFGVLFLDTGAVPSDFLSRAGLDKLAADALAAAFVAVRSPAPALVLALLLERWLPISAKQRDLTRGFGQDLFWYAADLGRQIGWMPLHVALLIWLRNRLLGGVVISRTSALPMPALWILAFVANDFLLYWSHVLRHRVDFLWRFHAVHHSQRELNFFTQHRFHDLDVIVNQTIAIAPLLLLPISPPALVAYYAISLVHFRLYHSKIRTDYGPLRYILVTPQSHRIHHSRDPRWQNMNFGGFLSIWDHAFGTQCRSYAEYPEELGIQDAGFPLEEGRPLRTVLGVYAAQLVYPFLKPVS